MRWSRYRSIVFLFLGAIMLSAATPVIAKLIQLGEEHQVNGRNPISFCNLLFAGNLVALVVFIMLYYKDLQTAPWKGLTGKAWGLCLLQALIIGIISPSLFFLGIMYTNVVNVIIISTLQIPLMLLIGRYIFRETFSKGILCGAGVIILGVLLSQLLQGPRSPSKFLPSGGPLYKFLAAVPYSGEACLFLAILVGVASVYLSRYSLRTVPAGFFNMFKLALGTLVFFLLVIVLFGFGHFAELFSPFLWKWMLVYGGVIVGLRTYVSFLGLKEAQAAELAISSALIPVFSIFFAFLILGKAPTYGQWIGGSVTLLGILVALYFKLFWRDEEVLQKPVGFSGI